MPDYTAETADHYSAAVEQKLGEWSLRGEGYYNIFSNISYRYSDPDYISAANGERLTRINSGDGKNYGFELMLKKSIPADRPGFNGWINYSYTQAKARNGVPDSDFRDIYIDSGSEQVHAVKLVGGYRWPRHSISAKYTVFTSMPYTKIIGDDGDPMRMGRYAPTYADTPNTERYEPSMTLDLRYSFHSFPKWGEVSIYVEAINVLASIYKPKDSLRWRYDKPFEEGVNPVLISSDAILPVIPNFGVEIKF
jgi:outer membrane receptor protein involved in Fe transport